MERDQERESKWDCWLLSLFLGRMKSKDFPFVLLLGEVKQEEIRRDRHMKDREAENLNSSRSKKVNGEGERKAFDGVDVMMR